MEKIDCFFNLFTTFSYLKLKTFHSLFKFQRFKLNIELLNLQFQGGQTFMKKSVHFQEKSVQSVQFSKKKSVQSVHFF